MIRDMLVVQEFFDLDRDLHNLQIESIARSHDKTGLDVYFGVLPRRNKSGTASAVLDQTMVLWADLDTKVRSKDVMFSALSLISVPPPIIVDSGYGYHAYWLIDKSVEWNEARLAMKGISMTFGGDSVYDKARVLRMPGTHNHKRDSMGVHPPVRLIRFDPVGNRHPFSDFSDYVDLAANSEVVYYTGPPYAGKPWDPDLHPIPDRVSKKMEEDPGKGLRSEHVFSVVCNLVELGLSDSEIEDRIMAYPLGVGAKLLEQRDPHRWLSYSLREARKRAGYDPLG